MCSRVLCMSCIHDVTQYLTNCIELITAYVQELNCSIYSVPCVMINQTVNGHQYEITLYIQKVGVSTK